MHKSFFAALSAAALLLSPISALANEEMIEVDEISLESSGSTGVAPGATSSQIALDSKNFPDSNFLDQLKEDNPDAKIASDVEIIKVTSKVKDLTGLQYLVNAKTFVMNAYIRKVGGENAPGLDHNGTNQAIGINGGNANTTDNPIDYGNLENYYPKTPDPYNQLISSIDLSKCTKLEGVAILGSNALTSVTLPQTVTLRGVFIQGNKALTTLDLSPATALNEANVSNNDLAVLNIKADNILTSLNASGNSIYQLDLSNYVRLKDLNVSNNELFELGLPSTNLTRLWAQGNKLSNIDISKAKNLTVVNVANNMLQSLKLPQDASIEEFNCSYNHLASLDLSKGLKAGLNILTSSPALAVNNQVVYANDDDTALNLLKYDPKFDVDNVAKTGDNLCIPDPQNSAQALTTLPATPVGGYFVTDDDDEEGFFIFDSDASGDSSYYYNTEYAAGGTTLAMDVTIEKEHLLNRLYNPNSGEHFYTKSTHEKDVLVGLGWQDEGIGWVAPTASESAIPVYRLYNPNAGDHHYTKDANEKDILVTIGWNYEGVGWYSALPNASTSIEVFREYNPNAKAAGAHNYTINEIENHTLVSIGWMDEGIAWWALK